mmetsp:Transcript_5961/g.16687  ORF Transcript_5961/g.16687 Transcript_5961/m.16687 type:complete len:137 (+) Transcript_5961:1822-2232(+)
MNEPNNDEHSLSTSPRDPFSGRLVSAFEEENDNYHKSHTSSITWQQPDDFGTFFRTRSSSTRARMALVARFQWSNLRFKRGPWKIMTSSRRLLVHFPIQIHFRECHWATIFFELNCWWATKARVMLNIRFYYHSDK